MQGQEKGVKDTGTERKRVCVALSGHGVKQGRDRHLIVQGLAAAGRNLFCPRRAMGWALAGCEQRVSKTPCGQCGVRTSGQESRGTLGERCGGPGRR